VSNGGEIRQMMREREGDLVVIRLAETVGSMAILGAEVSGP